MNNYLIGFLSFFLLISDTLAGVNVVERSLGVVQIPIHNGETIDLYSASYALLIGESNYTDWPDLKNIPSELNNVEELLKSQGFYVVKAFDLDSVRLKQAFEDFINQYGFDANNRLLFFFSGHGYTRKNGDKGYIVPTDAPNPELEERQFIQKAIDMEQITTWARRIESKHALFLFDSCFSGTIFKAKSIPKIPKYIDKIIAKPVRQFITAGSADETVPAKSVFTPAFVDAIQESKADINKDGFITGTELGAYLTGEVPLYTEQTPQFGKIKEYDLAQGDFVFTPSTRNPSCVALVIGNSNYLDGIRNYPNVIHNINAITPLLTQLGFEVVLKQDMTQFAMEEAIIGFTKKLDKAKMGLVYFSGDGFMIDGRDYFATIDGSDISEKNIAVEWILKRMGTIATKVIISDASRSNREENSKNSRSNPPITTFGQNVVVAFSTQPGELALAESPYTESLVKFLTESPNLPFVILFKKIVRSTMDKTGYQQRPEYYFSISGEEPSFAICK